MDPDLSGRASFDSQRDDPPPSLVTLSLEVPHLSPEPHPSLHESDGGSDAGGLERERIQSLEEELARTRADKEMFEAQYRSLLGKLTTMRNTLGDKLKQDAVRCPSLSLTGGGSCVCGQDELDRREQEISDLRAANEDLELSVDTLKNELINSHEDAEHAHGELEQLRLRASDSQKHTSEEATSRELALRDAQEDLERVRMEKEEWEGEAMRERVRSDELEARLGQVEMELAGAKGEREVLREERDREAESAANLHAVLEEFQAGKCGIDGGGST